VQHHPPPPPPQVTKLLSSINRRETFIWSNSANSAFNRNCSLPCFLFASTHTNTKMICAAVKLRKVPQNITSWPPTGMVISSLAEQRTKKWISLHIFRKSCYLHLQSTLKKDARNTFETAINLHHGTRRHVVEYIAYYVTTARTSNLTPGTRSMT
jgi:hypothetical protein